MSRIVIDSNVWISAAVFGGRPRQVFEIAMQEGHVVPLSEEIITEIRRILHAKFADFIEDFEALLAVMEPRLMHVRLGAVHIHASRDEDDNRILETAVIGKADYIISGDRDLLDLEAYRQMRILTPHDAVMLLRV